jgi:hypothetical protein
MADKVPVEYGQINFQRRKNIDRFVPQKSKSARRERDYLWVPKDPQSIEINLPSPAKGKAGGKSRKLASGKKKKNNDHLYKSIGMWMEIETVQQKVAMNNKPIKR